MTESPEKRSLSDILAVERQRSLELESKMKSALKRTNAETGAKDEDAAVTQEDCMVPVIGFLSPTLAALAVQTAASPNTLLMQRVCRTPDSGSKRPRIWDRPLALGGLELNASPQTSYSHSQSRIMKELKDTVRDDLNSSAAFDKKLHDAVYS